MDTKETTIAQQNIHISEIHVGSGDARYDDNKLFKDSYIFFSERTHH